jgi:uncharacterized protein YndB with AHSA1/START domain
MTEKDNTVLIERDIKAPIDRVFEAFINSEDLMQWHNAGEGWQTPYAEVDATEGGKMKIAYADPEGTVVFDFEAVIERIEKPTTLHYFLGIDSLINGDERHVTVDLSEVDGGTHVRLEFEIENINDKELQRDGWTKHIDNLQKHLEGE